MCLTLFRNPVTLTCGHSLCTLCKDGLRVYEKTKEGAAAIPAFAGIRKSYSGLSPTYSDPPRPAVAAVQPTFEFFVTCPSCRGKAQATGLTVSIQLRASIGALFPAIIKAREVVDELTKANHAAAVHLMTATMALHQTRGQLQTAAAMHAAAVQRGKAEYAAVEQATQGEAAATADEAARSAASAYATAKLAAASAELKALEDGDGSRKRKRDGE